MIEPVTLAVIRGHLEQIVDEMDATLFRAAFSPVIARDPRLGLVSVERAERDDAVRVRADGSIARQAA